MLAVSVALVFHHFKPPRTPATPPRPSPKLEEWRGNEWRRTPESSEELVLTWEAWPADIRRDISNGTVRVGHTILQMRLARSKTRDPVPITIYHDMVTAAGLGQAWVYSDKVYVVVDGRVFEMMDTVPFMELRREDR